MANVTVPPFTEAPSIVVGGTLTTVFAFDFPFWASADILVYKDNVLQSSGLYTVAGLAIQSGQVVEGGFGSGTVTFTTGVNNCTIKIDRKVVGDREAQFSRSSPLDMRALNGDLNRVTARQQDLDRQKLTTPAFDRAGKFLGFDADSNPVALIGTGADSALRADVAASTGASLLGWIRSATGALARTVSAKLGDWIDARDFGALPDGTTQQAAVQAMLDSIPTRGALPVMVPPGVKFDPDTLTRPRRSHMLYFLEDSTTTPGYFAGGSGELVWHMQNSSYRAAGADGLGNDATGGEVNEVRFTSNFHPGLTVNVVKSVGDRTGYLQAGQSLTDPARASLNFLDDGNGVYRLVYQNGLTYSPFDGMSQHAWFRRVRLTGIGTAQWVSVPPRGTLVTGVSSGARGHVVAVTAGYTDLELFDGRFAAWETVTDNNETTAVPATITYGEFQGAPLSVDPATGAWSFGDRPPRVASEQLNTTGRIRVVPTRQASYVQPKQVTKPGILFGESEETGTPHAVGFDYDPAEKTDSTRRLRVVRQTSPALDPVWSGELVPNGASATFGDAGIFANNWSNVASVTNSGAGLYDVAYTQAVVAAFGVWSVGIDGFFMPGWTAGVTFQSTTGCQIRVRDPAGVLTDIPPSGVISFKTDANDVI